MSHVGRVQVRQQVLEARVIRADGTVEDLGVIAFWDRNPFKRLAWRIGQLFRGRRPGRIKQQ